MSLSIAGTVERSHPHVINLIQGPDVQRHGNVTVATVAGRIIGQRLQANESSNPTQLVVVAGGAAGGKSTLARELAGHLGRAGKEAAILSADDFVLGDRQERQHSEASGLAPEEKYDFAAFHAAIGEICLGNTVQVPKYDAFTGRAVDGGRRRDIPAVDVLIAEGDMLGALGTMPHDLDPNDNRSTLAIYTHIPDRIRLHRRVERDAAKRNSQPETVIESFELRQQTQHEPYTLTYAEGSDLILTSPANPPEGRVASDLRLYDMHVMQAAA